MTAWTRLRRGVGIAAALAVAAAAATITVYVVFHHPAAARNVATPCHCSLDPGFPTCLTDPDNCDSGDRAPGGSIVVAVGKSPRGWNPGSTLGGAPDTAEELTPVLPSAFIVKPSGEIAYNTDLLASEPQVVGQRPVRIVYRLRSTARWNDGAGHAHPVTAQDFVFAWRALRGLDKNLPLGPVTGYDRIAGVAGTDQTVTVTLREPYADWRGLFTRIEPYWFAAAASGADPADPTRMTDAQLEKAFAALDAVPKFSAGPYMIKEVGVDGSTVEVPNPLWYGAITPTLTSITFRETEDGRNASLMRNKDIGVFTQSPDPDTLTALSNTRNAVYHLEPGYSWEQLQFNTADPFLKDGALRSAIMDVIDVQTLIDRAVKPSFPDARRLYSHNLFPGQPGFRDVTRQVDPVAGTGDLDAATKLLAAAGYSGIGRADSLKTPGGRPVTVTFVHTDTPVRDANAGWIGNDIARLGITVTDRPTSDLTGTLATHRFGIAEFGLSTDPLNGAYLDLWGTHGASNFTGWGNARSDGLLAAVARTIDPLPQATLLNQQDQILTAAHVDLPLYQLPQLLAHDSRYVNIRLNPAGGYVTYNTQEWGLRAG